MATTYLPRDDHIARCVRPTLVMRDEETNEAIGVFPGAFELRRNEQNLSVSWEEYFRGGRHERMRQIVKHSGLTLGPRHGYAVIQVGLFSDICANRGANVRVIHEPTDAKPSSRERSPVPKRQSVAIRGISEYRRAGSDPGRGSFSMIGSGSMRHCHANEEKVWRRRIG
jgi:hypothetical protein